jgi:acyl-homoserine lactone acylase PvdQ
MIAEPSARRRGTFDWFGSNSWAGAGAKTPDGATLLAGDGHLQIDIPSIFYQIGLDTSVLGGGDIHQVGLTIPGFPVLAVGTNGNVAWCQTQLSADVTDWYREEIRLDPNGLPLESMFQGEWRPCRNSTRPRSPMSPRSTARDALNVAALGLRRRLITATRAAGNHDTLGAVKVWSSRSTADRSATPTATARSRYQRRLPRLCTSAVRRSRRS